jgi:RNA polymerase sigma factor (sigma-70 family)
MFSVTPKELAHIERRALHYAFKLKQLSFFRNEPIKDLQQDLLLKVIESWKSFDEQKGRIESFAEEVLKHSYANLMRDRLRLKRQAAVFPQDLEGFSEDVFAEDLEDWTEEIHRRIDVERYVKKSPAVLRKIMEALKDHSVRNVAQKLQIPRSQLTRLLESCRQVVAPLEGFVNGKDFLAFGRFLCTFR